MKFELTESFRTGVGGLDEEHRGLMSHLNAIADLEQSADRSALVAALAGFKAALEGHFRGEEAHLAAVRYPNLEAHAAHHAETIGALARLVDDIGCGERIEGGVARLCFHELISVVLLRDMEFVNWMSGRRKLGT